MNFKEVTAEDLFGKGVTGLPDTPGLSTTDMQAKFDELVKDVMVPKFNALVRELAVLSGVESVTKELENTETSIPTGSAVAKYIEEKGSGNATVEEMTWAEYEALSEEEKMDGTLRVITDRKAGVRFGNVDISGIGDGTVTGAISALNSKKPIRIHEYKQHTCGSTDYEPIFSVTIPANSFFCITAYTEWGDIRPSGVAIGPNGTNIAHCHVKADNTAEPLLNGAVISFSGFAENDRELWVWGKWYAANTLNRSMVEGFYIPA